MVGCLIGYAKGEQASVGRRRLREALSASYTGLLLERWVVQPSYRIVPTLHAAASLPRPTLS